MWKDWPFPVVIAPILTTPLVKYAVKTRCVHSPACGIITDAVLGGYATMQYVLLYEGSWGWVLWGMSRFFLRVLLGYKILCWFSKKSLHWDQQHSNGLWNRFCSRGNHCIGCPCAGHLSQVKESFIVFCWTYKIRWWETKTDAIQEGSDAHHGRKETSRGRCSCFWW